MTNYQVTNGVNGQRKLKMNIKPRYKTSREDSRLGLQQLQKIGKGDLAFSLLWLFLISAVASSVIQSLASFVEPILDLIADHTGWKVTLVAGGPEPADAGRLNMIR